MGIICATHGGEEEYMHYYELKARRKEISTKIKV
jgi:hypothetical protein